MESNTAVENDEDPLARARVCEVLKDRPRMVDFGLRQEFLASLQNSIEENRKPSKIADRVAREGTNRVRETTEPVIKNRAQNALERINRS